MSGKRKIAQALDATLATKCLLIGVLGTILLASCSSFSGRAITVQRVNGDTILFTNNSGDALSGLAPASPIIVYAGIGGGYVKDITDHQAATKDGPILSINS